MNNYLAAACSQNSNWFTLQDNRFIDTSSDTTIDDANLTGNSDANNRSNNNEVMGGDEQDGGLTVETLWWPVGIGEKRCYNEFVEC